MRPIHPFVVGHVTGAVIVGIAAGSVLSLLAVFVSAASMAAGALVTYYKTGAVDLLDAYSDTALTRVWKAERFSWWMTSMLHKLHEQTSFETQMQLAELDYLASSRAAQTSLAENYVGLPY